MQVRLQKVIAGAGFASRRQAEMLIRQGHVTVNGTVVHKLGTCVDPQVDHVKVNGDHVGIAEPEAFILLHKPVGYLTTMKDTHGRPTVADLVKRVSLRVVPVGRLDFDAEGLLLLTNNGKVAQACLHPKYHVPKTYLVKVSKVLTEEELEHLRQGVQLEDGMTSPAFVKKSGKARVNSWIEMTIHEGRSHQVKRMLEALGHWVLRLKRIRFGPLGLGDLLPGTYRFATDGEANALRGILERIPRREKVPSKMTRTPGAKIQSVKLPVGNRSSARVPASHSRLAPAKPFPRKPLSKMTQPIRKNKPAVADRSTTDRRLRPMPSSGMKMPRGPMERTKIKRPSFPHGVKPQVVLQAFMDHEKRVLDDLKERSSRYLTNPPLVYGKKPPFGRKPDSKSGTPSRAKPAHISRSRNSSKPRPATPKGQSRSTTPTRPQKSRVVKGRRG